MNLKKPRIRKWRASFFSFLHYVPRFRSMPGSFGRGYASSACPDVHGNHHCVNYGIFHSFGGNAGVFDGSVSSGNLLIAKLSRSGDVASACRAFDEMQKRDVVSWNSVMSACLHNGQPEQALSYFRDMCRYGFRLSPTSFSVVVSSCGECGELGQGRVVHGLSVKCAYSANVFVGTSLITFYSKCKLFDCLCRVFEDVSCPSLATWNALISGYAVNHQVDDGRCVFDRMPIRNVISWTSLMNGYVEVKRINDAFELFQLMPVKNSVTWSILLGGFFNDGQYNRTLYLFSEMLNSGVEASESSIATVIRASSCLNNFRQGRKFHAFATKIGYDLYKVVESSLVCMYVEHLDIDEARMEFNKFSGKYVESWNSLISGYISNLRIDHAQILFDQMNNRDPVTWNLMIDGYLSSNRIDEAVQMLNEMPEQTVEAMTSLMSAYINDRRLDEAQKLFYKIPNKDVMACSSLLCGYMRAGQLANAWDLFEKMPYKNIVTYNIMITGLVQHGKVKDAYKLFCKSPERDSISWSYMIMAYVQGGFNDVGFRLYHELASSSVKLNALAMSSLITACANLSLLSFGEQFHATAIKHGFTAWLVVANSLINMYSKCGDVYSANDIFEQMLEHDLISWNTIIFGFAANNCVMKAFQMFEQMETIGLEPDSATFTGVLCACANGGLVEKAWNYFLSMKHDHGIAPELSHYSCMVSLLCKRGLVTKAAELVNDMPVEPDSIIWTILLNGCKYENNVKIAERAANQLFKLNNLDMMPYLHLSSIYTVTGRKSEVNALRTKMNKYGMKKKPGCSWIDISGRTHSFLSNDETHLLSGKLQTNLRSIFSEIKVLGYSPNHDLVMDEMDDQ